MISGLIDIFKLLHVLETKMVGQTEARRALSVRYGNVFVEQEDVLKIVEPIFYDLFIKFGNGKKVNKAPFPRLKYKEALGKYGTDKPDLRNPIEITDATEIFKSKEVNLKIFKEIISKEG